jgi:hypothetical protein
VSHRRHAARLLPLPGNPVAREVLVEMSGKSNERCLARAVAEPAGRIADLERRVDELEPRRRVILVYRAGRAPLPRSVRLHQ